MNATLFWFYFTAVCDVQWPLPISLEICELLIVILFILAVILSVCNAANFGIFFCNDCNIYQNVWYSKYCTTDRLSWPLLVINVIVCQFVCISFDVLNMEPNIWLWIVLVARDADILFSDSSQYYISLAALNCAYRIFAVPLACWLASECCKHYHYCICTAFILSIFCHVNILCAQCRSLFWLLLAIHKLKIIIKM